MPRGGSGVEVLRKRGRGGRRAEGIAVPEVEAGGVEAQVGFGGGPKVARRAEEAPGWRCSES